MNNVEINIEIVKNMLGERDLIIKTMEMKIQELEGKLIEKAAPKIVVPDKQVV